MTIANRKSASPTDAAQLALQALAWALAEERRAQRLLDLTGLTPQDLRERLDTREVQAFVLDFLLAHEPDLIAAADALGVEPATIPAARQELDR